MESSLARTAAMRSDWRYRGEGAPKRSVQSATNLDAVASAIDAIETSGVDATVIRVEPDDLVTIADIARRMARTQSCLALGGRGAPGDVTVVAGNCACAATGLVLCRE